MQHFHGVVSLCALIMRWTIASPILFSILTPLTTVLSRVLETGYKVPQSHARCYEELIFDVDKML